MRTALTRGFAPNDLQRWQDQCLQLRENARLLRLMPWYTVFGSQAHDLAAKCEMEARLVERRFTAVVMC